MKKFILISPKNRTVYNFRGDLVKDIIKSGYEVVVTGPNQIDVDRIEALGARFVEIPMEKNGVNPLHDIIYTWRLYKLIKREKPDATLGYTIKPVIYGAMAAKMAGVKNIASMVTGVGYLFTAKTVKAKLVRIVGLVLYKLAIACSDRLIFQNVDDQKEFVANGLLKIEKSHVVNGSGVNMEHFSREPLPTQTTFFMLSRALYSKGVKEYLEACRIVHKKHPEVRLMFLGAVEKMPDALTWEMVQSYIDDGSIEYFPETNDVRQFTKQCSVFVLPSYREGTPRTVLEAMAMGRGVITTDAPGCRETVKEGVNGCLVPVKDAEAVAEKMCYVAEHPEVIEQWGVESYRYCKEKFEISKVNNSMLEIMKL